MQAFKLKVKVTEGQLVIQLPPGFPPGDAEVIVLSDAPTEQLNSFGPWLDNLLKVLPPAPEISLEALRRENLYE
jgi:hypothetical protein